MCCVDRLISQSLADLFDKFSLMSASGRKAAIRQADFASPWLNVCYTGAASARPVKAIIMNAPFQSTILRVLGEQPDPHVLLEGVLHLSHLSPYR